jgi:hypothetical protein
MHHLFSLAPDTENFKPNKVHSGNQALKDTYASMIGIDYDLRAPDYSYLVIAELRDFYYQKFEVSKHTRIIPSRCSSCYKGVYGNSRTKLPPFTTPFKLLQTMLWMIGTDASMILPAI